ncbi:phosphotransferase [Geodermatophilus pulveris]
MIVRAPLGIQQDYGTLTTAESRNLVRKVRLDDGTIAVLKVIGNVREPGEGETLQLWRDRGLPCVEPLDWGCLRVQGPNGRRAAASWILTRFVAGTSLQMQSSAPGTVVRSLVAWIRQFHISDAATVSGRPWHHRLDGHLRQIQPLIRSAGLSEPPHWQEKLLRLSQAGSAVLHGDPAGSNVLVAGDDFVLLDPPGALRGMPEADVAQMCWHVGGVAGVSSMINVACDVNRRLNPDAVAAFASFNLLVWAGYELAGHYHPEKVDATDAASLARDRSQALLDDAAVLLQEYRLP